jgi:DNA-3-methyladenine glycosylase
MHWCANVVCGPDGDASAVLLRAGEVVDGVDLARRRRVKARADRELARGPARLCTALGIDGTANGAHLLGRSGPVTLQSPAHVPAEALIHFGPRVGVAGGHDMPWRFWLAGEPSVTAYRRHLPRRR